MVDNFQEQQRIRLKKKTNAVDRLIQLFDTAPQMKGCDEGTILVPPEEGEMRCEVVFDDGPMVTVPLKHLEASHAPSCPKLEREWLLQKRLCKTKSSDHVTEKHPRSKRVVKTHVDGDSDPQLSCGEAFDVNPELLNTHAGEAQCDQDEDTVVEKRALAELVLEWRACQVRLQVAESEAGRATTQVEDAASEVQRLSQLLGQANTECSALLLQVNALEMNVTACRGANGIVDVENAQLMEDMTEMSQNAARLRELNAAVETKQRKEEEEKLACLHAAWLNELEDNIEKLKCEKDEQEQAFLQEVDLLKVKLTSLLNGRLTSSNSDPLPVITPTDSDSLFEGERREVSAPRGGVSEEQENPLSVVTPTDDSSHKQSTEVDLLGTQFTCERSNSPYPVSSMDSQSERECPEVNFLKAEFTSRHSSPPPVRMPTDLSSEQERHREQLLQHVFHKIRKQISDTQSSPPRTSVPRNLPSGVVSSVPAHQTSTFTNHRLTYPCSTRFVGSQVGSPRPPQPPSFQANASDRKSVV